MCFLSVNIKQHTSYSVPLYVYIYIYIPFSISIMHTHKIGQWLLHFSFAVTTSSYYFYSYIDYFFFLFYYTIISILLANVLSVLYYTLRFSFEAPQTHTHTQSVFNIYHFASFVRSTEK